MVASQAGNPRSPNKPKRGQIAYAHAYVFSATTGKAVLMLESGRIFPQISGEWRYPFTRRHDGFDEILQPIVAFSAAPEPSTMGLMAAGLAGFLLTAWRRRNRRP